MEICLGWSEITEGRAADDQFQWRIQWKQLLVCSLRVNVRQDAIVCLTRSESEAVYPGKTLGAFIGGFVGGEVCVSAGVVAATLFSIPGIAQVTDNKDNNLEPSEQPFDNRYTCLTGRDHR